MASGVNCSNCIVNRLATVLAAALAACTCPPTTHVEQTYAPPQMSDAIELCKTEGSCTVLCSRAFLLEANVIDRCRIVELDSGGGAFVEVTWSEYVCQFEEWDSGDYGDDGWTSDDDYDYDDYDPCDDGSCDDYPDFPDDPPDDDPPPDDPPDDDDPPMDEGL